MANIITKKRFSFIFVLVVVFILQPHAILAKPAINDKLALMWQVQSDVTDKDLLLMKTKGINLVQSFNMLHWSDYEIQSYLDRMNKHGLGVIISIDKAPILKRTTDGRWTFDHEKAQAFINRWKGNPAIFAWHTCDEASGVKKRIPVSLQKEMYDFVKKLDPQGNVFVSWNGFTDEHYKHFFSEAAFDILDIHGYMINKIGNRQRQMVAMYKKYKTHNYPLIITISTHYIADKPDSPLPPDGIQRQYDYFFKENHITDNVGYYGWELYPNKGISQIPDLGRQFNLLKQWQLP